jgi:hypothetical protein
MMQYYKCGKDKLSKVYAQMKAKPKKYSRLDVQ